jgi:hypothetical protein
MGQEAQGLAHRRHPALVERPLQRLRAVHRQRFAQGLAGGPLVQRLFQDAQHLALVDGGDRHFLLRIGRRQQAHQVAEIALHRTQQVHAVLLRHPVVGDQHREFVAALAQQGQRLADAGRGDNGEFVAEGQGEPFARRRLVVDEQDGARFVQRFCRQHRTGSYSAAVRACCRP